MKRIYVPTKSPEDWKRLLPEPEKQWVRGRSARTLAHCWEEADGFPQSVKEAFICSEIPIFSDIKPILGIPEHQVPLPGGVRPSQSDLWVLARTGKDLVSIAVEGKVSETFGPTVNEWFQGASMGKKERLEFLCGKLGIDWKLPGSVRYQLLHRTVSSILEAERFNAVHALMLVHSFSPENEWFGDYERFVELFGVTAEISTIQAAADFGPMVLYFGWVRGEERYLRA